MPRRLTFALAVTVLGWAALAWVHLYRFSVPWADTWCYLGPAAAAPTSLHIISPFLSSFHHSDKVWGLHFPGGPLLLSLVFGGGHFSAAGGVLIFIALWAALAIFTALMVARLTDHVVWGAIAGITLLIEHGLFEIAQAARPELIAGLVVLLLWASLSERGHLPEPQRLMALGLAEFLCPLMHPMTLAVGGTVAAALSLRCWFLDPSSRRPTAVAVISFALGLVALACWFLLQPGASEQLTDHAHSRLTHFAFGSHLWFALQTHYSPIYSGHLFWLAGMLLSVAAIATYLKTRTGVSADAAWAGLIVLTIAIAQEKFQNIFYLFVGYPECVALVVIGVAGLTKWATDRGLRLATLCAFGAVIVLNSAFWFTRTAKFLQAGRPHLRAELSAIAVQLKGYHQILIPEILWEYYLPQRTAGVNMNTLPQWASTAYRRDYEALVFSTLVSGDLVVVDRFQAFAPITDLKTTEWKAVARFVHILPGRNEWGYDLTVYQKN